MKKDKTEAKKAYASRKKNLKDLVPKAKWLVHHWTGNPVTGRPTRLPCGGQVMDSKGNRYNVSPWGQITRA